MRGAVFDVAVDIRKSSTNFGNWVGAMLIVDNKKQLWIPPGFAHGFVRLTDAAEFWYKTTDIYAQQTERCIVWEESTMGVHSHHASTQQLSTKDLQGLALDNADIFK